MRSKAEKLASAILGGFDSKPKPPEERKNIMHRRGSAPSLPPPAAAAAAGSETHPLRSSAGMAEEQLYRQLGVLRSPAVMTTETGTILFVNRSVSDNFLSPPANRCLQALQMLGYQAAEELLDKDVAMLMPEPFARDHATFMRNYLDGGRPKVLVHGDRRC
jgi:hypothetical protein